MTSSQLVVGRQPTSRGLLRDLWQISGPERRSIALGVLVRCLQGLCLAIPVGVIVAVIHELRRGSLDANGAIVASLVTAAAIVAQLALTYLGAKIIYPASYRLTQDLRRRTLERLVRLPLPFHAGRSAGDLLTFFTQDLTNIEEFVGWSGPSLASMLALPLAVMAILAVIDPPLGIAIVISVLLSLPVFAWTQRRYEALSDKKAKVQATGAARIVEYIQGQAVIRAYDLAGERTHLLRDALDDLRRVNRRLAIDVVPVFTAFATVLELGVGIVILAVAYSVLGGRVDTATGIIFLVLAMRVYQPLLEAAVRAENLPMMSSSLKRIRAVLDEPLPPEPAHPAPEPQDSSISFADVTFSYVPGRPVVRHLSLDLPSGSTTAIVGASGAGKTTLLHLLAGLYRPEEGTIRIGGVDVGLMTREQRSRLVSVVFQDVYLFSGTIYEAISLGRLDATPREVEAAARMAGCHDLIVALPSGYETRVGEGGQTLSGGERQRVSIARAMVADTPIILLDEATAAVDATTERALTAALAALARRKTLLVVAHRLSTIRAADRIAVLDAGSVVEQGSHEDLLALGGRYARFWSERERAAGWRLAGAASPDPRPQPAAIGSVALRR